MYADTLLRWDGPENALPYQKVFIIVDKTGFLVAENLTKDVAIALTAAWNNAKQDVRTVAIATADTRIQDDLKDQGYWDGGYNREPVTAAPAYMQGYEQGQAER